jgi:collagen type IV alpha-3-binding protein
MHNGPVNVNNIDFRGEAITFKATTAGILASLSHCIDSMAKREDYWQKKCEKEVEKRRKAELAAHAALNGPRVRAYQYAGPDFEEGPHSALNEEEFFDALEMAYQTEELEHMQHREEREERDGVEEEAPSQQNVPSMMEDSLVPEASCPEEIQHKSITGISHSMSPLVHKKAKQYARYLFDEVGTNWNVVYEDGDMKVYRRELEEEGVVVDPLKSFYTASNVSAREVTNYFFDYDTRMEWEGTIESATIVEALCDDTIIFHHLHKRVWPSTQRETVFCSHICTLPNAPRAENQVGHTWMVINFSVEHTKVPISSKLIRAVFQIGLVCQTISNKPVERGMEAQLTRDDISCKILYATNVNPGGWAPPSVVRTIGKREITKFLKKFSSAAQKKTASSPLSL